jgi:hypothetical protein
VFVGIDVSKHRFDAATRAGGHFRSDASPDGAAARVAAPGPTLVADARKLLVLVNAVLRDHRPWNPQTA